LFSNIDLLTGNKKYNTFFYQSKNFQESPTMLNLGNNIMLDKKRSIIRVGQNQIPLNSIIITEYDKNGKLHLSKRSLYPQSSMYMIIMRNYHQILLMDSRVFNSTYIQLFVLENYDKNLFEPVILTPLAKVYRLKK
jgi:dolichyl-diphosphooligosaccharide--protein glycosyltransferase/undecaprenyl-diphosphooligosaccharide--protein glycosyltransferase